MNCSSRPRLIARQFTARLRILIAHAKPRIATIPTALCNGNIKPPSAPADTVRDAPVPHNRILLPIVEKVGREGVTKD